MTAFASTGSEAIVPILGAESGVVIGTLDVESDRAGVILERGRGLSRGLRGGVAPTLRLKMARLYNLVVDLVERPATPAPAGIEVTSAGPADDRTLAWIDECFGGAWSSEAHAGINVVASRAGAPIGFATVDPKGLTYAWLDGIARERDTGIFGPFGVAPGERKTELGRDASVASARRAARTRLRARGYSGGR